MAKYIFITGGVVSSLGKGITGSAIGAILKSRGFKVSMQKFDPYINVDPGTMSPLQHGEVYVTEDGAETDLDLGHYERFIDENLSKYSSVSAGRVYSRVIENERAGKYGGKTVQVIPHITDQIKSYLRKNAERSGADIIIVEIGGTVGDIESLPFLEAIRQARREFGYENTIFMHATLVPYLKAAGELKTKPTQHSVKELKSLGIQPDMLVLRSEEELNDEIIEKISLFTDIDTRGIFESYDLDVIYKIIPKLKEQKIDDFILEHFGYKDIPEANIDKFVDLIERIESIEKSVDIAIVGKYTSLHDAYLSITEALDHAGYQEKRLVKIKWVPAERVNKGNVDRLLKEVDGILIPGGFGEAGTEGKMLALKYARENKVPLLGICFGMQLAVVEYARNVLGHKKAGLEELGENKFPLISLNACKEFKLGAYPSILVKGSKVYEAYNNEEIVERHRHKYEFNSAYLPLFDGADMIISGYSKKHHAVEVVELKDHPWFLCVQYHPEYKSRPLRPHPLFVSFLKACIKE